MSQKAQKAIRIDQIIYQETEGRWLAYYRTEKGYCVRYFLPDLSGYAKKVS